MPNIYKTLNLWLTEADQRKFCRFQLNIPGLRWKKSTVKREIVIEISRN